MLPAASAVLLHSLDTRQGASNIIPAMTRRDVGKPAFSLRKKRFVKTHALSLLRTKNLRYAMLRFQDFQRSPMPTKTTFKPAWCLRNNHLQTIYPALLRNASNPPDYRRERLTTFTGITNLCKKF